MDIRMEPSTLPLVQENLGRESRFEHRRLDAGHGCCLANDVSHVFTGADCYGAGGNESADVFLALPAGALADIVERRTLLLISNVWAFVAVAMLIYLTLTGETTPAILLTLTFAVGLGEALEGPPLQAVVTELVAF